MPKYLKVFLTNLKLSYLFKEKLTSTQETMGRVPLKLLQETRWNSTFLMLKRLYDEREPVGAAMASLTCDILPLTSEEYSIVEECLSGLSPIHDATVELSAERKVSGSKAIPLMIMVDCVLQKKLRATDNELSKQLGEHLSQRLREKLCHLESYSIMSIPTLLDPRFKTIGFLSQSKADEAVKRLTAECILVIKEARSTVTPVSYTLVENSGKNNN